MKKPRMNTRLLRRVANHFLEEPLRLGMDEFVRLSERLLDIRRPPCGTTQCIAGAALILRGLDPRKIARLSTLTIVRRAAEALGITYKSPPSWSQNGDTHPSEALSLFLVDRWPEPFQKRYYSVRNKNFPGTRRIVTQMQAKLAKITADRIEHFIKTRE